MPIYSDKGSELYPGRWNTPSTPVIYTSEHFATAMLEKLVHCAGMLPPNQHYLEIQIPRGTSYEVFDEHRHPQWADPDETAAKDFGAAWVREKRSAILIVPSLPARVERNVRISLAHPDAAGITYSLHKPIWWNERLFSMP